MEKEKKKSLPNWALVILVLIGLGALGSLLPSGTSEEAEEIEEVVLEDAQKEGEEEEKELGAEEILTKTNIKEIRERIEEALNEEREFLEEENLIKEGKLSLYEIDYYADTNRLELMIDYNVDPILPAEELIELNEVWAWVVAEAMPNISEKDFDIKVTAVTKLGEEEFIYWGTTRYYYQTGEYTFIEGAGMALF